MTILWILQTGSLWGNLKLGLQEQMWMEYFTLPHIPMDFMSTPWALGVESMESMAVFPTVYIESMRTWGSGPLLCMAGYSSLCELFFIMSKFDFDRVNPLEPNFLVLDNINIEWEVKLLKLSKYLRSHFSILPLFTLTKVFQKTSILATLYSIAWCQKSALCSKLESWIHTTQLWAAWFLRLVNGSNNQNKIIVLHIKYVKMCKNFILIYYSHLQVWGISPSCCP